MEHPEKPRLADEIGKMEKDPILPIERKLVLGSVIVGAVLLGILVWVSYAFFPAQ